MDRIIAKNYIYNVVYRILSVLIPFITTPYLSRVLKPEGIGVCSYTSAIATLFAMFATLGFVTYGQREVAYKQDDIHGRSIVFFEIEIFRAITTILAATAFCVFSLSYKKYTYLLLPQCITIISGIFDISWYYQGLEEFRITVMRNIFIRIVCVILIFTLVKDANDILLYIVIVSVSSLVSNLFFFISFRKYIVKINFSDLRPLKHMRGAFEFFIPLIAVEIYSHLDRIMLGYYFPTNTESGYYEQARKLITIVVSLIISINDVMLPRIAKLYAKSDRESMIQFYRSTFKTMLMIMLPACAGLFLISDNFVLWFFGHDYSKVAVLLKLSSVLIAFMCIGNFVGVQYLSPTGQQNKMTMAYITAAISNVALNALLIPRLASEGAMIASIVAEMISCGIQLYLLLKSKYRFNLFEGVMKYAFATVGMTAVVILLHAVDSKLSAIEITIAEVVLGLCIYVFLLLVMREENIMILWRTIKKNSLSTAQKE